MARKCRHAQCRKELPKTKDSQPIEKAGFCSYDCMAKHGIEKAKASPQKIRQVKRKEASKEKREFNRKDIKWQHKQCQPVFNRMRVLEELQWFRDRGMEPECISCGKRNMDWCCGHFKTVGAQSGLRYDRMNTYLQCNRYCNKALSGNIEGNKTTRGYKQGLRDRFGDEEAERIIEYCDSQTKPVKWDWQDMEEWRKEWAKRVRELTKTL